MKRRNFLKSLSAYSAPFMIGGIPISAAKPLGFSNFLNGDSDHILVLIQLTGGNDGLNTVLQLDNYDALANHRANILIPESDGLSLTGTDTVALHPSMVGIRDLYDRGMVNIVQNVAYANQNRSHFRSTDIWTSASESEEFVDTGWLGRHLAEEFPGYPDEFPNMDCPDPLAITIGNFTSETCQGTTGNYSIAVGNIDQIRNLDNPGSNDLPDNCYGHEMEFLIESIQKTNAYASRLTLAADNGTNVSSAYLDGDRFAGQLMTTARLISGGLQSKIYILSLGGFDTHAGQVDLTDTTVGDHANLWNSLSSGISAFYDDMKQQGFDDKIVCMTFSEFGRQIKSNGSAGTDHGTAAPMFIFGNCVEGGVTGDNIPIPMNLDPQTGVPMQFDFRDVYGTVLEKWFDVDQLSIKNQLHEEYQALNIFSDNCLSSVFDELPASEGQVNLWPNPSSSRIQVSFENPSLEIQSIEIFDIIGGLIQKHQATSSSSSINITSYTPGQYFARVRTNRGYVVKPFLKL